MAQEMADLARIDPAVMHQLGVFVDADIEQVRQQADILAQQQRAGRLGLGPRAIVQMRLPAGGLSQLHAHRIVARERALVYPFEAQPHAVGGAGQRL